MISIAIVDKGQVVPASANMSPEQLQTVINLARGLIGECERRLKASTPEAPAKPRYAVPYT